MLSSLLQRFQDWRDRRAAFQEMKSLKREEKPYEDGIVRELILRITSAAYQNRPQQTLEAWHALRIQAPDIAATSNKVIAAMCDMRHFDEAEQAVVEAQKKFPNVAHLAAMYADIAQRRHDWPEAARRWAEVRAKYPDVEAAHTFGATCLHAAGQPEEAERIIGNYLRTKPDDLFAAQAYADMADQRNDLATALERWATVRQNFRQPEGWVGEARLLVRLGREEEALERLSTAQHMFLYTPMIDVEMAVIHDRHGSPEERLKQWMEVRIRHPSAGRAYIGAAQALVELGRMPEAEAILQGFIERDSDDPNPAINYAFLAHHTDWPEAARRWAYVRQRYPDMRDGFRWGADALDALGQHDDAAALRAAKP